MNTDFNVLKYDKRIFKVPIFVYFEGTTENREQHKKLSKISELNIVKGCFVPHTIPLQQTAELV